MTLSSTAAANKRSCASRGKSGQTFSAACPNNLANRSSSLSGDAWEIQVSEGVDSLCGGMKPSSPLGLARIASADLASAFLGEPAVADDFRHDLPRCPRQYPLRSSGFL
jgi:hypothetical protein